MFAGVARLCCLTFGVMTLLLVGVLTEVRRTPIELRWVVFSAAYSNSDHARLYRMLSDGSHLQYLTDISTNDLIMVGWERPGWLAIDQRVGGGRRLSLLHLNGQEQVVLEDKLPFLLGDYYRRYYDAEHDTLYLMVTIANQSRQWTIDLKSGNQTVVDMPMTPSRYRSRPANGGFVFWSDATSAGDFYRFQYGNPPTITQLTTRGDISSTSPPTYQAGWLYYYVGQTTPPATVALYRMREDGSDEQLVIPAMLLLDISIIRSPDPTRIHYWGGTVDQPQLMRVNADGSNPTPLAIAPIGDGSVVAWSPDGQWLYYRQLNGEARNAKVVSNLYRMDVNTGQSFLLLEDQVILQDYWSADGAWLVLLIEDAEEHRWLYRMRPDGSEMTQFGQEVRDYGRDIYPFGHVLWQMWDGNLTRGDDHFPLHSLDLDTLEIRRIDDGLGPAMIRTIEAVVPVPEQDWRPWGIAAIGAGGTGLALVRRRGLRRP